QAHSLQTQSARRHAKVLRRSISSTVTAFVSCLRSTASAFGQRSERSKRCQSKPQISMTSNAAGMNVDRDRLVEWALRAVSTPSFTGSEEAMARLMEETLEGM